MILLHEFFLSYFHTLQTAVDVWVDRRYAITHSERTTRRTGNEESVTACHVGRQVFIYVFIWSLFNAIPVLKNFSLILIR